MGNSVSSDEANAKPQASQSQSRQRSQSRTGKPYPAHIVPNTSPASTSTSDEYATATVTATSASAHSRQRSTSTKMGQSSSSEAKDVKRPPSRSNTLPPFSPNLAQSSPSSQPVNVPQPSHHDGFDDKGELTPPSATSPFGIPASQFNRPPRLPLPIERDPEPASPIITPQDTNAPPLEEQTYEGDVDSYLPKRASLLSSTTLDEDDAADIEQFAAESDPLAPKVSTTLLWKGDAETVYVTGTFASWEKKFRMHKTQDGSFAATIPLKVGTHHITFLVDGEPGISKDMPTTVDFANALVNYIEVAAPEKQPAEPMPIPGASGETTEPAARSLVDRTGGRASVTNDDLAATLAPEDVRQPSAPQEIQQKSSASDQYRAHSSSQHQEVKQPSPKPAALPKKKVPRPKYTSQIPDLLLHLDLYNSPEDERYRRASKAIQNLPQPPSLPMFMSKSILNATTPTKDDASVLTMPNHTVLNHLATSSIRNGVLATSGTTRYKRKFLTTIMYKPTSDDG